MLGHGPEAERLVCTDLMFDERVGVAVVQGRHRSEIRRLDAELLPKVLPQVARHVSARVESTTGHAHEADMNGQRKAVEVSATRVDQHALLRRKREESGELKLVERVRDRTHSEIGLPPVFHCRPLRSRKRDRSSYART